MAEKGKSRGAASKAKRDKSRTPVRAPTRLAKTSKTPGRTPTQPTPSPDEVREPLDAGPILDDLLDRVLTEVALAAAKRQRVPFTVSRARDAILFVAEWRFLARDDGDPDPAGDPDPERDGVWSEDEEPQTCCWDSWTPGAVPVVDVSLPSEEVPSEDLPVTAEDGGALVCPGEVSAAVPVLPVPLPPGQVPAAEPPCQSPSAAAAAPSARLRCTVMVVPLPGPTHPEPPIAPRAPGRGRILSQPPRPQPAPLGRPRRPAPLPAAPSEPPAQGPQESRGATADIGDQVPPSSRPSLASIQPRRPSHGTGVPRLGARRGATRWVLPEVKVVDVTVEPDWARSGASRVRLALAGSSQVLPGAGKAPKAEPQLCDPWLASAQLAPGVTVRWGGSERRGPPAAGQGGRGDGEQQEDAAVRKAEQELKPILPYPECWISEYGE